MKKKKLIFISLIVVITLVLAILPFQMLTAGNGVIFLSGGTHKVSCGSANHTIEFDDITDGTSHTYQLDKTFPAPPPGWTSSSKFYKVEFKNAKGEVFSKVLEPEGSFAAGVGVYYTVSWDNDTFTSVYENCACSDHDLVWIKFYYTGSVTPCPPQPWVRTMPMTCWQVWINEDNNFQFIFWYPYKDENFVRIYDLEDNLVFETDLPWHDPNLIVDLPDGMYMVKTYHGEKMLQEFLIGKPGPKM